MIKILNDLSVRSLVPAIESNMFDFWTLLGRSPRVEFHYSPEMILFSCDIPSPFCNNVLRAQLALTI